MSHQVAFEEEIAAEVRCTVEGGQRHVLNTVFKKPLHSLLRKKLVPDHVPHVGEITLFQTCSPTVKYVPST